MHLSGKQVKFYKRLCASSSREIGIEMFFDNQGEHNGFRMLVGTPSSVPTWGTSTVFGHTHPSSDDKRQQPPSSVDFHRALWDYFAGVEWQMVFERRAVWAYRPNAALVAFMELLDPDIRDHMTRRQQRMVYRGSSVTYMRGTFDEINEKVLENIAIDNAHLSSGAISVEQYIENVGKCIDNNKRGFDVIRTDNMVKLPGPATRHCEKGEGNDVFDQWESSEATTRLINETLTYSWVSS